MASVNICQPTEFHCMQGRSERRATEANGTISQLHHAPFTGTDKIASNLNPPHTKVTE